MFNSLRDFMSMPIKLYKQAAVNVAGDKISSTEPIAVKCYRADEIITITTDKGTSYVSMSQLYLDEVILVTTGDNVEISLPIPTAKTVVKVQYFYSPTGKLEMQVAYL